MIILNTIIPILTCKWAEPALMMATDNTLCSPDIRCWWPCRWSPGWGLALCPLSRGAQGNVSPHHQRHSDHIKQVSSVRYQSALWNPSDWSLTYKSVAWSWTSSFSEWSSNLSGQGLRWSRRVKHPTSSGQRPFIRRAGLTPSSHPCSPRVLQWGAHYKLSHNVFMLSK